ncbi:MAG: ATP/GTP-binding protein, partial [Hominimerdicola sp.]
VIIVMEVVIMIELFKIRNFMSFKDEAVLDLRATSYTQHQNHVIKLDDPCDDDKNGLLKTTAIYGANASGKSNLISAMFVFRNFVLSQLYNKVGKDGSYRRDDKFIEPFALSDDNSTTEFEIVFRYKGRRIQYGFELLQNDSDNSDDNTNFEIVNEWYYADEKEVFERNGNILHFGSKYRSTLNEYNKLPSDRLYMSVLDYFLEDSVKGEIIGDFIDYIKNQLEVFFELTIESTIKKLAKGVLITNRIYKDKSFKSQVEKYIRKIDVGIERLEVRKQLITDQQTNKSDEDYILKTVHKKYDESGNEIGEIEFDLPQESDGTLRFLGYIQKIIYIQERGGVFVIDELSAKLHPLLTKFIVELFQSSDNNKAQLIFTTHDISQLNKEQFRRDEVVFVDKNQRGESRIYSLADLKVREDSTFNKDYIRGKYGAIPIFKDFDDDKKLSKGDDGNWAE